MPHISKRYKAAAAKVEERVYSPVEALDLLKANATAIRRSRVARDRRVRQIHDHCNGCA